MRTRPCSRTRRTAPLPAPPRGSRRAGAPTQMDAMKASSKLSGAGCAAETSGQCVTPVGAPSPPADASRSRAPQHSGGTARPQQHAAPQPHSLKAVSLRPRVEGAPGPGGCVDALLALPTDRGPPHLVVEAATAAYAGLGTDDRFYTKEGAMLRGDGAGRFSTEGILGGVEACASAWRSRGVIGPARHWQPGGAPAA
eukprot:365289-Chlamydomonas_euryale.AAC.6